MKVKKININNALIKNRFLLTAAWLAIPIWVILITILSNRGAIDSFVGPQYDSFNPLDMTTYVILFVPIAVLAFVLGMNINFNGFSTSNKEIMLPVLYRVLISLLLVIIVLAVSWYLSFYIGALLFS